ncbi:MAG: corrinoid protein [Deltaproteobacteria bacterium]|nr:corrinoid protein [Deltaproteobacteria bacterium]
MVEVNKITQALMNGEGEKLVTLVFEALQQGRSAVDILNDDLVTGMDLIGDKMGSGEMFIPEVLMAAHTMQMAVEILKPHLGEDETNSAGKIVIGTVKGDLHDIGKNLVVLMLESAGFEVIDLGVDVEPELFIDAIIKNQPDILGLSALLTTTMPMLKKTVETIANTDVRKSPKIMIGGAPVNQNFADEIGADGYAPDAGSASKLAKAMLA